jgi:DNA-binding XRE family transcriptional regulator
MQLGARTSSDIAELVRLERLAFAAKIRMGRAVLGWSQSELALHVGLTQRGIHKLEQGETEPRRTTVRAIETVWHDAGIGFEDLPDGGFRVSVYAPVLKRPATAQLRRRHAARNHLGVTSITHPAYRA